MKIIEQSSLTQLLGAFFENPQVVDFRLITQGKENTTIKVDLPDGPIIVRIWGETHGYMGVHSNADIADEVAFMDFCRRNGAPVPRLMPAKDGSLYQKTPDNCCYAVMEYVDGETPQNFTDDMAAQIAKTMAQMHVRTADFTFPEPRSWPGSVLDMTNDRISKYEAGELAVDDDQTIAEAIAQYRTLLAACDLSALPKGVIHGDIMWENIKFKNGKLHGIFDFGDCRESYFVEDIAKTLLFVFESPEHCVFGQNGHTVPVFLQNYQAVRQLTKAEEHSLPLFYMSRFLYQVLGYYIKAAKGKTECLELARSTIARYNQHRAFFMTGIVG